MHKDVYRKLAQRLDALPNGFPATESGVELRLLAKIFTPEEARLANVMSLTRESVDDIASRAGADSDAARRTLEGMVSKGLISRGGGKPPVFGLRPFVVGFYEAQLPRLDEEMAALFEQYYQDSQGGLLRNVPSFHRVLPVGEAIPFEMEIFPYESAAELLEKAKSWAVRDCICRVQQRLVGKGCDRPVENCVVFAPVEGAFAHSEKDRAVTKEEALRVLHEAQETGLVHSSGNYTNGNMYICNCCTCCCGILRGVAEFEIPTAVARSDFRSAVEAELCIGCGDCVERCQFGALSIPEDVCVVDHVRCVGCGLCVTVCSVDAIHLERCPAGQVPLPPADMNEWRAQRLEARGILDSDML